MAVRKESYASAIALTRRTPIFGHLCKLLSHSSRFPAAGSLRATAWHTGGVFDCAKSCSVRPPERSVRIDSWSDSAEVMSHAAPSL